ncbi:MAG: S41 family peptidase [Planctomyces sp.]
MFRICSNVIVTLFLALNWLAVGHAEELKPAAWSSAPEALQKCEELETARKWGEAIQLYEKALESFAGDQSLKYGLRRARIHHAVERRYGDLSFQGMLNDSGRTQLLNMFEDVYRSVQREYLESVSLTRFLAHGTESLYMALKNPVFIEKNFPDPAARQSRINSVRQTLISTYWNRPVSGVAETRQVLGSVCDLCRRELNLKDSAVLLEYVFGGCNALDEYSVLLTPDRYRELHGTIQGEMVGLGIEMKAEAGRGMHLLNVLLGSPAEEGGLRPDDYITDINSTDCRNLSTDDAAKLLRGSAGSAVRLSWISPDNQKHSGEFTRRRVDIHSITRRTMLDRQRGIGYIRMEGFQEDTVQELDAALRSLEAEGLQALVLDLRGNPGGLLDTAAAVAERFIGSGVVVSTRGRNQNQNQVYRVTGTYTRPYPLALIVDGDSASASEIIAGAVRDHNRGVIVGRPTYGKWSVQTIVRMPGEREMALRLTTAKFYSPDDRNYSGVGLQPDVLVPDATQTRTTFFRTRTPDEINADPDVAEAISALQQRLSRN